MSLTLTCHSYVQAIAIPAAVMSNPAAEGRYLTKKRISAVVAVLVTAMVVTGIVVGVWIFTEQEKAILQVS